MYLYFLPFYFMSQNELQLLEDEKQQREFYTERKSLTLSIDEEFDQVIV